MLNHSLVRSAYDAIALFAVLNMIALGGIVTYAVATGAIDGEKVERIASVMRGGEPTEPIEAVPAPPDPGEEIARPAPGEDPVLASEASLEVMRREAERIKEELRQRLALNNSIMLRATAEREAFREERATALAQSRASQRERQQEGFEKQVAILTAMKPKVAVQHLLGIKDPDEAARILLEMSTRKAQKIVEAAKTGEQVREMMVVLQRIREVAPDRSAELGP